MRELLVLTRNDFDKKIANALQRNRWKLKLAGDAAQARSLAEQGEIRVGLAVFPHDEDEALLREYEDILRNLAQIKWIAALTKRQAERTTIKSLIVDHLYDFQLFPLNATRLSFALGHAHGIAKIEEELQPQPQTGMQGRFGLIGTSRAMQPLYRSIERAGTCDLPVLILGATGTGKEQVARAIHAHSSRASGPFLAVNCGAIPSSLMQSELFGYEKGAFTHAFGRKQGYIEAASGGTLLLDEIGEMPLDLQGSLLRFLDDHIVTPLGGTHAAKVDVRILATTNRDLPMLVASKAFRADLYYRLAVLSVRTPKLKDREDDIIVIAEQFLQEAASQTQTAAGVFTEEALKALRRHAWPGNLRELRNRVFQAALQNSGGWISSQDLGLEEPVERESAISLQAARDGAERKTLESTLEHMRWNMSKSAKVLKVSRMTLYRLVDKHGLNRGQ